MHIDKQITTVHSGYASYLRDTETAKVEGLWLVKRTECLCQNTQMTVSATLMLGCALLL